MNIHILNGNSHFFKIFFTGQMWRRKEPMRYNMSMDMWIIWILLAATFAVAEMMTAGFVMGPIALVMLAIAGTAALGLGLPLQIIFFCLGSIGAVMLLRPLAKRHMSTPAELRTGTAALIGAGAVVTMEVNGESGQIKLSGETWSARALDEETVYPVGAKVEVLDIKGATALITE